jgi:hypothetical protein
MKKKRRVRILHWGILYSMGYEEFKQWFQKQLDEQNKDALSQHELFAYSIPETVKVLKTKRGINNTNYDFNFDRIMIESAISQFNDFINESPT